jgi:hypothetical protein
MIESWRVHVGFRICMWKDGAWREAVVTRVHGYFEFTPDTSYHSAEILFDGDTQPTAIQLLDFAENKQHKIERWSWRIVDTFREGISWENDYGPDSLELERAVATLAMPDHL